MTVDASRPSFADWLLTEIHRKDISYRALGREIGVHASTIGHWVSGRSVPEPTNCIKLAEVFSVDPDYVLDLAGHRPDDGRDELADMDPEMRLYFLNYHTLPPQFQRMLKEQMRVYYENIEREKERDEQGR